jgi:hypothetical protein
LRQPLMLMPLLRGIRQAAGAACEVALRDHATRLGIEVQELELNQRTRLLMAVDPLQPFNTRIVIVMHHPVCAATGPKRGQVAKALDVVAAIIIHAAGGAQPPYVSTTAIRRCTATWAAITSNA